MSNADAHQPTVGEQITADQQAEMDAIDAAWESFLDARNSVMPTYEQQVVALAHRVTWLSYEEFDRQIEKLAEAHGMTPFAVESDALRHMSGAEAGAYCADDDTDLPF